MLPFSTIFLGLSRNIALLFALAFALGLLLQYFDQLSFEVSPILTGVLYGAVATLGILSPFSVFDGAALDGTVVIIAISAVTNRIRDTLIATLITLAAIFLFGGGLTVSNFGAVIVCCGAGLLLNGRYRQQRRDFHGWQWYAFGWGIATIVMFWWFFTPYDVGVWRVAAAIFLIYPAFVFLLGTLVDHENQRVILERQSRARAKTLEQTVADRTAELETALKKERELASFKRRFDTLLMHEVITPVSIIRNALEAVLDHGDKVSTSKQITLLQDARVQAKNMTELVQDIISISRSEVAAQPLESTATDLAELIASATGEIARSVGNEHQLTTTLADCPAVAVDRSMIRRAITNLLANAIRYSPEGSEVRVNLECDAEMVTISVHDTGIGIPESEQGRVFEMFYRADNVGDTLGTGVGLAYVKHVAELHGGNVWLESAPEKGTRIFIRLPVD